MHDIASIKSEIKKMAELSLKMLETTFQAFMEHDMDIVQVVLEDENTLNAMEHDITSHLIECGKSVSKKNETTRIKIYLDVVGDLELIGDYCKDILERVQIKIEERLLFSDEAVKEYVDLYTHTQRVFARVTEALVNDDYEHLKKVADEKKKIESLIDEYRTRHAQRLVERVCSPLACNMFLNIIDFTAEIYAHAQKIARNLSKVK